jgi:hypothetical protein
MVQPKYSPEEALQRVKLMMKYDSSKTLNENKETILEQSVNDVLKQTVTAAGVGAAAGAVGGFGVGAIPGAIVGGIYGLVRSLSSGNASRGKIVDLIKACSTNKELGKKTLSDDTLDKIGDSIKTAVRGFGTDEEAIKSAFSQIPTIPDLCGLVNNYKQFHGNLVDDLDDDLEGDDEWSNYIALPLRPAMRTSIAAGNNTTAAGGGKTGGGKTGGGKTGGGTQKSKYTPCTAGKYVMNCKSDVVKQVQACLGMPSKYQTGNFGPITKGQLQSKFSDLANGFTDSDVAKICNKQVVNKPVVNNDIEDVDAQDVSAI